MSLFSRGDKTGNMDRISSSQVDASVAARRAVYDLRKSNGMESDPNPDVYYQTAERVNGKMVPGYAAHYLSGNIEAVAATVNGRTYNKYPTGTELNDKLKNGEMYVKYLTDPEAVKACESEVSRYQAKKSSIQSAMDKGNSIQNKEAVAEQQYQ